MSNKSSAIRSSRSSARYFPYSNSPSTVSTRRSRLSSSPGHDAESLSSDNHFGQSADYSSLHPTLNSAIGHAAVLPFVNSQQLSISTPQLEHYASAHQPADPSRLPFPQGLNRPPRPSTNSLFTEPTLSHAIYPLLNSQSLHAVQPSITINRPEDRIYQNYSVYQQTPHLPLGHASNSERRTNQGSSMFNGAQHFTIEGGTFGDNISDDTMEKLLHHTIIGAEYDSSDRYPPPRCHPGTRIAIVQRCKVFIVQCNGKEKMRWVVGPAGVGKSAIMQMVAEEAPADASIFFSVNGRRDGTRTFTTIAYQLGAKYEPYRQFISKEIGRDQTFLRKALPVQFQKFIVEPFIHQRLFNPSDRFLVIIDGLDECDNPSTQREILRLISGFCLSYPTSPIVWFVASRPEPHITSFFDDVRVAPTYTKEEIMIDSNEACEDVQRYLHAELDHIKFTYPNLKRKRAWPSELEFTKIATASGGLFAFASTVVRYIGDSDYGDPVSQLDDVLVAINAGPKDGMLTRNNPLALLDALYDRIISKIPDGVMINTRKLLLIQSNYEPGPKEDFRRQCNRLGLTENVAYGAVRHLHAVLKVPTPDEANDGHLTYFHKSFSDFLSDFNRSRFSPDIRNEVRQLMARCSLRIVEQVPDNFNGMASSEYIRCGDYGFLTSGPGFCDDISLSWPGDERLPTADQELRLDLYRNAMAHLCDIFNVPRDFSWTVSCLHALTTRFIALGPHFPVRSVLGSVFDKLRPELMDLGKLKQVPLRSLDYAAICGLTDLRFTSPVGKDTKYSNPWLPICQHPKYEEENVDGLQRWRSWTTIFARSLDNPGDTVAHTDIPRIGIKAYKGSHRQATRHNGLYKCRCCFRRLARHFIANPDQLATVFVDSTEMCYVELSFIDPDDGMSEWRYRFYHSGFPPST